MVWFPPAVSTLELGPGRSSTSHHNLEISFTLALLPIRCPSSITEDRRPKGFSVLLLSLLPPGSSSSFRDPIDSGFVASSLGPLDPWTPGAALLVGAARLPAGSGCTSLIPRCDGSWNKRTGRGWTAAQRIETGHSAMPNACVLCRRNFPAQDWAPEFLGAVNLVDLAQKNTLKL